MKKTLIVIGWVLGGVLATALIAYVPGALDLVDDEKWGRIIGGILFPTAIAFLVAGVLFAQNKRVAAYVVAGLVTMGYVLLDAYAIVLALS